VDDIYTALSPDEKVVILSFAGYFNHLIGEKAEKIIESHSLNGKTRFLFDFSRCQLINSPGVASMVDIVLKITDDFKGRIALTGLDQMKHTIFKMVHVIPSAYPAPNTEDALRYLTD
jgi:hypothetical protein